MKQLIIIVVLVVLSAVITFSTTDKLIVAEDKKERKKEIFKRRKKFKLSWRLYVLVFAFLGIIGVSIWQFSENETEERQRRDDARAEQSFRDSIAEVKSNRRNDSTVRTITEALAKYNLEYDSANQRIEEALRDSLRNQKSISIVPDPLLQICGSRNEGINLIVQDDFMYKLEIMFCSKDASSTNFEITISLVLSNSFSDVNDFIYLTNQEAFSRSIVLPTNESLTQPYNIPIFNIPTDNYLFVLLRGKYKSVSTGKTLSVDQLYFHNIKGKTFGLVSGETEKKVREFISKNEKQI